MAAFADDDDAAAVDAILTQAPTSKIPELLDEASKRGLKNKLKRKRARSRSRSGSGV